MSSRVAESRHLNLFFPPRTRRPRHRPHAATAYLTTSALLDLKVPTDGSPRARGAPLQTMAGPFLPANMPGNRVGSNSLWPFLCTLSHQKAVLSAFSVPMDHVYYCPFSLGLKYFRFFLRTVSEAYIS